MKALQTVATFLIVASNCLAQTLPGEGRFSLSPQLKNELVDTITRITERRRAATPHGYEKDEAFFGEFLVLRSDIIKTLQQSAPLVFEPDDLKRLTTEALSSYQSNYQDFVSFYSQNPMQDSAFKSRPADEIAGQLLTLYMIVYSRNEALADQLKKGTYIWPFCRPKSYGENQAISPGELFYAIMNIKSSGASIEQFIKGKVLSRPLMPAELILWKRNVPPEIIFKLSSPYR